ncbi:MAG: polysaccharide deacetylase family protein [Elusimicrobiota bacterium]
MHKFNFHLTIYRYEVILAMIILLMTGSIAVSSRDAEKLAPPSKIYPLKVAITFDDGPHPKYTETLLRLLKDNGVRATFFLVGRQAMEYPNLVRMIVENGHEIESHTLTHRNLAHLSVSEIKAELSKTADILENLSGQRIAYFRPPGGQFNVKVIKAAEQIKMFMVLWTVFPKDHEEQSSSIIIQKVMSQVNDGGVVLFHSGREPTYAALPVIIKLLRDKGYRFVTVSELHKETPKDKLVWLK